MADFYPSAPPYAPPPHHENVQRLPQNVRHETMSHSGYTAGSMQHVSAAGMLPPSDGYTGSSMPQLPAQNVGVLPPPPPPQQQQQQSGNYTGSMQHVSQGAGYTGSMQHVSQGAGYNTSSMQRVSQQSAGMPPQSGGYVAGGSMQQLPQSGYAAQQLGSVPQQQALPPAGHLYPLENVPGGGGGYSNPVTSRASLTQLTHAPQQFQPPGQGILLNERRNTQQKIAQQSSNDHQQRTYGRAFKCAAFSLVILLACGCWWSIPFTFIAMVVGFYSDDKSAKGKKCCSYFCCSLGWILALLGLGGFIAGILYWQLVIVTSL